MFKIIYVIVRKLTVTGASLRANVCVPLTRQSDEVS